MQAWEKFLSELEVNLGKKVVEKWLHPLKIVTFDARNLYLEAENSFQLQWFEDHIRPLVEKEFKKDKKQIKIHLNLPNNTQVSKKKKNFERKEFAAKTQILFEELNASYTFDSFVKTSGYEIAHNLLSQLAENPKTLSQYNPIYLCGPKSSGKTHLLVATALSLRKQGLSVVYARTETFTEHVVASIMSGDMTIFRQSYRNADVLIIDDVHLLSKKLATQEEFFHTFNALHLSGKQIILSANCNPQENNQIEPRLISRFEWGIVLSLPSYSKEERKKILSARAAALKFNLHTKILDFFTNTFSTMHSLNRALEALLLRIHLKNIKISSTEIDTAFVEHHLADLISEEKNIALNPARVIQQIAEINGITSEDILGKGQNREFSLSRQMAMYICRTKLNMPFTHIADFFSKDHSTVMSSVKRIQNAIEENDLTILGLLSAIQKKVY